MKKRSVWEERDTDNKEENDKWKGFGKDLEQAWYERSKCLMLRINMSFLIDKTTLRKN